MSRKSGITKAAMANVARDERAALKTAKTSDSFQNFAARLGIGTDNLSSASSYGFNPISRVRTLLEWMYRGSWIVGQAVDCIAEDMTKNGVQFLGQKDPKSTEKLSRQMVKHQIWLRFQNTIKWARLYGGAIAVIVIDGQDPATPLRIDTVGPKGFKGLVVLDRWMVTPSLNDLVTDVSSPDLGLPKFYNVVADAPAFIRQNIHHSRCIRFEGVELPYWQKISENLWGMSVIERIYDRLVAFDSGTQGASQLMYKAYLRVLKIPQLRELISAGGPAYQGLLSQVTLMRQMQTTEGMSVIDAEDTFEANAYAFGGIADTLLQFGQQLSGALQIPLVRLFGQSPAGLNSTGESDLRTYYDGISQRQETQLRHPVDVIVRVIARSESIELDPSFGFEFAPLWKLNDKEKADIAKLNTETIAMGDTFGLPQATMLKELRQQSRVTGIWTNITDEDIQAAELAPLPETDAVLDSLLNPGGGLQPPSNAEGKGDEEKPGKQAAPAPGAPKGPPSTKDALPLVEFQGLPIMVETAKGERRTGSGWEVVMPADYGFIRKTGSAEGSDEGMDVFVGPNRDSKDIWVIDQNNPMTGAFDEHKVMLGFGSSQEALACYFAAYNDGLAHKRVGAVSHIDLPRLNQFLSYGDLTAPFNKTRATTDLRASRA